MPLRTKYSTEMHSSNMGYGNVTPCQHGSKQGALIWECVAIILHQHGLQNYTNLL